MEPTNAQLDAAFGLGGEHLRRLTDDQAAALELLRSNLRDLVAVALFVVSSSQRTPDDLQALSDAGETLTAPNGPSPPPKTPGSISDTLRAVADETVHQRRDLAALPH